MSELTDRMRTCATRIQTVCGPDDIVYNDAAALLLLAATELENPPVVLQPWLPIEAPTPLETTKAAPEKTVWEQVIASDLSGAAWIDPGVPDLPTQPLSRNACPKCDSRAQKTVRVKERMMIVGCPACGHQWRR